MEAFKITETNTYDLNQLANNIKSFDKNYKTLKVLIKGRQTLFNNMHNQYPNMKKGAIVDTLSKQELKWLDDVRWDLENIRVGFANFAFELGVIGDRYDLLNNIIDIIKREGNEILEFSELNFS